MSCVACGLPVVDLPGQTAMLQPYLSEADVPPGDTAGAWHLSCLAAAPVAEQWGRAQVHSFVEVRGFEPVARGPEWTVFDNPRTGDRLALSRLGATLPLRGRGIHPVPLGLRVIELEYWLEVGPARRRGHPGRKVRGSNPVGRTTCKDRSARLAYHTGQNERPGRRAIRPGRFAHRLLTSVPGLTPALG